MKKYIIHFVLVVGLTSQSITTDQLSQLAFRNIGPSVAGGRIHDVEVVPENPEIMFIASASGGEFGSQLAKEQCGSLFLMIKRYPHLVI